MSDVFKLSLSKYERQLIDRYGYPFDEIEDQLEAHRNSEGPVTIESDRFWLEMLVGDLSRSINHDEIPDERSIWAVNALAERIEALLAGA